MRRAREKWGAAGFTQLYAADAAQKDAPRTLAQTKAARPARHARALEEENVMQFQMNRRRWLGASLIGVAGAGALGALLAAPALGGPSGFFGHGPRWGHHGAHRFDEERIREHVEWMLREVDASDAQIDAITRIASSTAKDLEGMREAHQGAHAQLVTALSGESVDRAALEALRSEHLAAAETASRQLTDALAQIAEVLTPAQRSALAAQHEKHWARHADE
jgi:Spy/CpxP family protein refolding chaperone